MNKTIKKTISILLALITVFSILSVSVAAEEIDPTGETVQVTEEVEEKSENPYDEENFIDGTKIMLASLVEGVATLPLIVFAPILFVFLPPLGASLVIFPLNMFGSVFDYFEALFTGLFWN